MAAHIIHSPQVLLISLSSEFYASPPSRCKSPPLLWEHSGISVKLNGVTFGLMILLYRYVQNEESEIKCGDGLRTMATSEQNWMS